MQEKARENYISVASDIQEILNTEALTALNTFEDYVLDTSIDQNSKVKIISGVKDKLSYSLGMVYKIVEFHLREKIFRNEMTEMKEIKVDQVDENEILKVKDLEEKIRVEKEKKMHLTRSIEVGKKRIEEMKEFLDVLERNENSSDEEILIKYLKMN